MRYKPGIKEETVTSQEHMHIFQRLLREIEAVRISRQEEYREQSQPQLKRFTQQELNDEACPTYKNWLSGRSMRLPERSLLMQIADYLECSLSERNDLLLAAQYLPEQPEWEGDAWRHALERAQQIMEALAYPAFVVSRTFQVHVANTFALHLLELPPFETIPHNRRSTIHFLFDPTIRRRSMFSRDILATWQEYTPSGIRLFKRQNVLSQYENWYQQSVQQWCELPHFREYWEQARIASSTEIEPTKVVLARMPTSDEVIPIRLQHMFIPISGKNSPAVSAFLPVDDAAHALFASFNSVNE